jgi:hypothetical protein
LWRVSSSSRHIHADNKLTHTVLNEELVTTMKMCGVTRLDELHPGLLNTRAVDHLVPESASEEHPYAKWRRRGSKL